MNLIYTLKRKCCWQNEWQTKDHQGAVETFPFFLYIIQMLQAAANITPRGVYVCGNTTTTSGLTVTLTKEGGSGDYALEAGALVLADQGLYIVPLKIRGEKTTFVNVFPPLKWGLIIMWSQISWYSKWCLCVHCVKVFSLCHWLCKDKDFFFFAVVIKFVYMWCIHTQCW